MITLAQSPLDGLPNDKPLAVAFNGAQHVAVGACAGGFACVWEGTARHALDTWPPAFGADFSQLAEYTDAVDVSADGKVIVGNGNDGQGVRRGWVLRLP